MAEKEERIFITKIQPACKFREMHETTAGGESWVDFMCGKSKVKNLECDDKCFEQCEWKELTGISRQEAINLMAKALVSYEKKNNPNGCDWEDYKESVKDIYKARAEAALNSLLTEDK